MLERASIFPDSGVAGELDASAVALTFGEAIY